MGHKPIQPICMSDLLKKANTVEIQCNKHLIEGKPKC